MRNWLFALMTSGAVLAQTNVISVKAGLVHHVEGTVTLDGKVLDGKPGKFADMKSGSEIRTEDGRAEILLAPGSFVRLGENSAMKMVDNLLNRPQVQITAGAALIEAAELTKDMSITVLGGGATVTIQKTGIYRFEQDPAPLLKIYDGEATVSNSGKSIVAKAGRTLALSTGGEFLLAKFDHKTGDELFRWAKRRSSYVSMASVAAANSLYTRGTSWMTPGWVWNPYFGMFTCIPARGYWHSPFGYRYFSPQMAYNYVVAPVYTAPSSSPGASSDYRGTGIMGPSYNPSYGYSTVDSRSSGGYSGGYSGSSSGGYSNSGAASAPAASGGGDSGMRGGGASSAGGGQSSGGGTRGN